MEISRCRGIESLEISVASLVSCTYEGDVTDAIPFKNTPNLAELTLGGKFSNSFIGKPHQHTSYSGQLVKLVLELDFENRVPYDDQHIMPADFPQLLSLERLEVKTSSAGGYSLHYFTWLIEASPLLQQFTIKIDYLQRKMHYQAVSAYLFHEYLSFLAALLSIYL